MIHAKGVKKSQEFAALEMKVMALKEQNKIDEQMSVADLRLLVRWCSHGLFLFKYFPVIAGAY